MASARFGKALLNSSNFRPRLHGYNVCVSRNFSVSVPSCQKNRSQPEEPTSSSWFKNLLKVRTIAPSSESHSRQLSDKNTVYELQTHCVKPEFMEEYLKNFGDFQRMVHEKKTGASLVGSFTVEIGDQDEAIHIWEYNGGYPVLNEANIIYRTDKPGTMIEWGNNWARGIQHRGSNDEAVAGFFSQVGELYTVYHLWGYTDLQSRKETREAAWRRPGWDDCVAHTVPLIRHMQSRILIPTPFSPLQ